MFVIGINYQYMFTLVLVCRWFIWQVGRNTLLNRKPKGGDRPQYHLRTSRNNLGAAAAAVAIESEFVPCSLVGHWLFLFVVFVYQHWQIPHTNIYKMKLKQESCSFIGRSMMGWSIGAHTLLQVLSMEFHQSFNSVLLPFSFFFFFLPFSNIMKRKYGLLFWCDEKEIVSK